MINSWPTFKIKSRNIAKYSSAKEHTENGWCHTHSVWNLFQYFSRQPVMFCLTDFSSFQLYAKQIRAFTDMHKSPKIIFERRQGKAPNVVTIKIDLTHEEIWRFLATKRRANFDETKHKNELKMTDTVRSAVYFHSYWADVKIIQDKLLQGCDVVKRFRRFKEELHNEQRRRNVERNLGATPGR